jgi:hypothetical protein
MYSPLKLFQSFVFAGCASLIIAASASAQSPLATLRFEPEQPRINEPVTAVVEGVWPNGCAPFGATLTVNGQRAVLSLREPPPELSVCTTALRPYEVKFPVQFEQPGHLTVEVIDIRMRSLGAQRFTIQGGREFFGRYDVGGTWYEPRTSGSGLLLIHPKTAPGDAIWGAWNNYRANGSTSWFALQGGRWESPTRYVGDIVETVGELSGCTTQLPADPNCPNPLNPAAAAAALEVGSYALDFTSERSADLVLSYGNTARSRVIKLIR